MPYLFSFISPLYRDVRDHRAVVAIENAPHIPYVARTKGQTSHGPTETIIGPLHMDAEQQEYANTALACYSL